MRRLAGLRWAACTAGLQAPRRWAQRRVPEVVFPLLAGAVLIAGCVAGMFAVAVAPEVAVAVAFGLSIAVTIIAVAYTGLAVAAARRLLTAAALALVALGVFTIVATAGVFPVATARWMAFGTALGYLGHGLLVLVLHAAHPSRHVHVIEVRRLPAAPS